jgi:hypothetical protein
MKRMSEPVSAANTPTNSSSSDTLSSSRVFRKVLRTAGLFTLGLLVVGGVLGYFVDSWVGVVSAVIGSAMAFVFLGITAGSILIANRSYASPLFTATFFAIVLGAWIVKFALFILVALLLRDQPWVNKFLLFGFLIIGVALTLVVDMVVIARTRLPYVSDVTAPAPAHPVARTTSTPLNTEQVLPNVEIDPENGPNQRNSGDFD